HGSQTECSCRRSMSIQRIDTKNQACSSAKGREINGPREGAGVWLRDCRRPPQRRCGGSRVRPKRKKTTASGAAVSFPTAAHCRSAAAQPQRYHGKDELPWFCLAALRTARESC